MEVSTKILSDLVIHSKYAKYVPDKQRRETWDEIVTRNKNMHIKKFPQLRKEILAAYEYVHRREVLPSMRSMQFAGKPVELNNARLYNCSFLPMSEIEAFSELMFLLLSGCGVGYSVQRHHVEKLPEIRRPTKSRRYLVGDSIEGWADAVKVLMKAYFAGKPLPNFDFSDIRPKGAALITSGGKAPGPEPLKDCLHNVQKILDRKESGDHLTSLEVHDINCYIADAVLSGGIRRSAMIALFDLTDEEMLTAKFGAWYEQYPVRARANNTAVLLRHKIDKQTFLELWKKIEASNSGEPGFMFSNDKEMGLNPCAEVSLRAFQFCNLTTINVSSIRTQQELNERAWAAAFLGTLQASYTNFHYLRDIWKKTTEKEALIGVSMTGIASPNALILDFTQAAEIVKETNAVTAQTIGINKAARTTVVKPEGTSSLTVGSSSGIHAWYANYYVRSMRLGKNEPIYQYLSIYHPELLEDEFFKPTLQAVARVPQKAPDGAITREETALDLLNRVSHVWNTWVKPGHRKGPNVNNVSTTVSIRKHEWVEVGEWMWTHRAEFTALSVMPHDESETVYVQAPYEEISQERYNQLVKSLHEVDLTKVVEIHDNTMLQDELACSSGACEVK